MRKSSQKRGHLFKSRRSRAFVSFPVSKKDKKAVPLATRGLNLAGGRGADSAPTTLEEASDNPKLNQYGDFISRTVPAQHVDAPSVQYEMARKIRDELPRMLERNAKGNRPMQLLLKGLKVALERDHRVRPSVYALLKALPENAGKETIEAMLKKHNLVFGPGKTLMLFSPEDTKDALKAYDGYRKRTSRARINLFRLSRYCIQLGWRLPTLQEILQSEDQLSVQEKTVAYGYYAAWPSYVLREENPDFMKRHGIYVLFQTLDDALHKRTTRIDSLQLQATLPRTMRRLLILACPAKSQFKFDARSTLRAKRRVTSQTSATESIQAPKRNEKGSSRKDAPPAARDPHRNISRMKFQKAEFPKYALRDATLKHFQATVDKGEIPVRFCTTDGHAFKAALYSIPAERSLEDYMRRTFKANCQSFRYASGHPVSSFPVWAVFEYAYSGNRHVPIFVPEEDSGFSGTTPAFTDEDEENAVWDDTPAADDHRSLGRGGDDLSVDGTVEKQPGPMSLTREQMYDHDVIRVLASRAREIVHVARGENVFSYSWEGATLIIDHGRSFEFRLVTLYDDARLVGTNCSLCSCNKCHRLSVSHVDVRCCPSSGAPVRQMRIDIVHRYCLDRKSSPLTELASQISEQCFTDQVVCVVAHVRRHLECTWYQSFENSPGELFSRLRAIWAATAYITSPLGGESFPSAQFPMVRQGTQTFSDVSSNSSDEGSMGHSPRESSLASSHGEITEGDDMPPKKQPTQRDRDMAILGLSEGFSPDDLLRAQQVQFASHPSRDYRIIVIDATNRLMAELDGVDQYSLARPILPGKCLAQGCTRNNTNPHTGKTFKYCVAHKNYRACTQVGCSAHVPSGLCFNHKCSALGCHDARMAGKQYCSFHLGYYDYGFCANGNCRNPAGPTGLCTQHRLPSLAVPSERSVSTRSSRRGRRCPSAGCPNLCYGSHPVCAACSRTLHDAPAPLLSVSATDESGSVSDRSSDSPDDEIAQAIGASMANALPDPNFHPNTSGSGTSEPTAPPAATASVESNLVVPRLTPGMSMTYADIARANANPVVAVEATAPAAEGVPVYGAADRLGYSLPPAVTPMPAPRAPTAVSVTAALPESAPLASDLIPQEELPRVISRQLQRRIGRFARRNARAAWFYTRYAATGILNPLVFAMGMPEPDYSDSEDEEDLPVGPPNTPRPGVLPAPVPAGPAVPAAPVPVLVPAVPVPAPAPVPAAAIPAANPPIARGPTYWFVSRDREGLEPIRLTHFSAEDRNYLNDVAHGNVAAGAEFSMPSYRVGLWPRVSFALSLIGVHLVGVAAFCGAALAQHHLTAWHDRHFRFPFTHITLSTVSTPIVSGWRNLLGLRTTHSTPTFVQTVARNSTSGTTLTYEGLRHGDGLRKIAKICIALSVPFFIGSIFLRCKRWRARGFDEPACGRAFLHAVSLGPEAANAIANDVRAPHAQPVALRAPSIMADITVSSMRFQMGATECKAYDEEFESRNAPFLSEIAHSRCDVQRLMDCYYEAGSSLKQCLRISTDRSVASHHLNHNVRDHDDQLAEEAYYRVRFQHMISRQPYRALNLVS
nr:hypothetical protein [Tolivirales sp.]